MAAAAPDGPSCYICLDEGPDDAGKPLVRDCSCRGDAAGFAHLSCIIKYAEQKSIQAEDSINAFCQAWEICPNCNQSFQNQLSLDLTSAFVSFADKARGYDAENSTWEGMKEMIALKSKIKAIISFVRDRVINNINLVMEGKMLSEKLLSMVDQMKKDLKMNRWEHMPSDSYEYRHNKMLCVDFEAFGYSLIGKFMILGREKESLKTALPYFEKARIIYNLFGMDENSKLMENDMNMARKLYLSSETGLLENARFIYENNTESVGSASEVTIQSGLDYAELLKKSRRGIEAEQLVMKLASGSRRVHGLAHNCTVRADLILEYFKVRFVVVMMPDKLGIGLGLGKEFQALRYENDGLISVVTGPITNPRRGDNERIFHVASDLIHPTPGTPVICHGLINASHLNGKVGDVRAFHKNGRLAVHFEDESQKPASVKPENLRIVFDLPTGG
ncbi:hypothetical protein ACHAW5_004777 [Stephanodiscus triporus]|uniref:RING-CH-type domain-containing protein n=1 Tax=Stephanodiscus triporus TaxID=2934178 RepID=A0ABD3PE81_9STRA